ncbi:LuxR C-terminal-related transcriptional regulator [Actinokineospora guangxiensis]|uniref:LuxR C-terminal-related transcriptional regulator n=1 Tax=Actinokineospora guangxiensis TaxID=1490288 RepID=A0ABW0EKX2_9PSEU
MTLPGLDTAESALPTTDSAHLSHREREVLDLLVKGLTNRALGRRLGISERTVREHIARIFLKLRVGSRVEAAVIATQWRLAAAPAHGMTANSRMAGHNR